ncbi:hypothetical protein MHPYR_310081 [uncultured Mycobacterium sp.]|uniref:Uncharacterized protein n=1 Tax=uncultured Mycobacterium sp. TaxID=171292 RepID=A0A1Y5PCL7_9MYCO|nr:hypothetical protein MHPYR_310081 [uncultured Mycobacterium sp.]
MRIAASAAPATTWLSVAQDIGQASDWLFREAGSTAGSVVQFFSADAKKVFGNPVYRALGGANDFESALIDYQNAQDAADRAITALNAAQVGVGALMDTALHFVPENKLTLWAELRLKAAVEAPIYLMEYGAKAGVGIATLLAKLLAPESLTVAVTSTAPGLPDNKTGAVKGNAVFSNPAGGTLTYTFTDPIYGALTVTPLSTSGFTGSVQFTYTPDLADQLLAEQKQHDLTDSFTITATNMANGQTATAAFTNVPIDPGHPQPATQVATETTPAPDGSVDVTIHTTDFPGGQVTYPGNDPMTLPTQGTITDFNSTTGTFTYTPNTNATGIPQAGSATDIAATETMNASGDTIGKAVFTTGITDSYTLTASNNVNTTSIVVPITTTINSATGFTYAVTTDATNGHATIDSTTGAFTYTPGIDATAATDSFTVTATDPNTGKTATEVVNIADPLVGTWSLQSTSGNLANVPSTAVITRTGSTYTEVLSGFSPGIAGGITALEATLTRSAPGNYAGSATPSTVQAVEQATLGLPYVTAASWSLGFTATLPDSATLAEVLTESASITFVFPGGGGPSTQSATGSGTVNFTKVSSAT